MRWYMKKRRAQKAKKLASNKYEHDEQQDKKSKKGKSFRTGVIAGFV